MSVLLNVVKLVVTLLPWGRSRLHHPGSDPDAKLHANRRDVRGLKCHSEQFCGTRLFDLVVWFFCLCFEILFLLGLISFWCPPLPHPPSLPPTPCATESEMRAIVGSANTNQMLNLCPQNEWAYWETKAQSQGTFHWWLS